MTDMQLIADIFFGVFSARLAWEACEVVTLAIHNFFLSRKARQEGN